jgi:hypothetical protein
MAINVQVAQSPGLLPERYRLLHGFDEVGTPSGWPLHDCRSSSSSGAHCREGGPFVLRLDVDPDVREPDGSRPVQQPARVNRCVDVVAR